MIDGTGSTTLMNHDRFFAVFNAHSWATPSLGRLLTTSAAKPDGVSLLYDRGRCHGLSSHTILWPGLFAIFCERCHLCNHYTVRRRQVHKDFNLISLSFWLFIGDVVGCSSNTWCAQCIWVHPTKLCLSHDCVHIWALLALMCSQLPVVYDDMCLVDIGFTSKTHFTATVQENMGGHICALLHRILRFSFD